jgi:hypothetical protein
MSTLNVRAVKALPVKRSEPRLDRTTFTTSRLLDFCNERELTAQIGHPIADWPLVIVKSLPTTPWTPARRQVSRGDRHPRRSLRHSRS